MTQYHMMTVPTQVDYRDATRDTESDSARDSGYRSKTNKYTKAFKIN